MYEYSIAPAIITYLHSLHMGGWSFIIYISFGVLRKCCTTASESFKYVNIASYIKSSKEEILMVTVTVDYSSCEGCGTCEALCPEIFEMQNEKAEVKDDTGGDGEQSRKD